MLNKIGGNMLYPSIDKLIKLTNSNYALAMATAKRARMLVEGDAPCIDTNSEREVTIAVEEFYLGEYVIIGIPDKANTDVL